MRLIYETKYVDAPMAAAELPNLEKPFRRQVIFRKYLRKSKFQSLPCRSSLDK